MKNHEYENIERKAREELKKRPKMKVSGKGVFKLAEVIKRGKTK